MSGRALIVSRPPAPLRSIPLERALARRIDEELPQYITREEAHAIIGAARSDRDRLLVLTLWHTGARISEVLHLRRCDFGGDHVVLPNLKQHNSRAQKVCYVKAEYGLALLTYCEAHSLSGTDYLFTAKRHGRKPISRQVAWEIVKGCAERAGVLKPRKDGQTTVVAWPHMFRHGHAVHLLRNGVPIRAVQDQLGHASMLSTQKYLRFTSEDKRAFIDQVSF